jgi:hypothetical protein
MTREPLASSNNAAESALSDNELDGVVGGNGAPTPCPVHPGEYQPHNYVDSNGRLRGCNRPIGWPPPASATG